VSCVRASGIGKLVMFPFSSSTVIVVQHRLGGRVGGLQVLAGGAMVAARAVLGSFWLRYRACGGGRASVIGRERAVGMVFRAKASTVGGNGGGAFGASFSPSEGTIEGHHVHAAQGSHGENPVLFGRATTAPLTSCPSWRRRIHYVKNSLC
jgi:hypothetical protein